MADQRPPQGFWYDGMDRRSMLKRLGLWGSMLALRPDQLAHAITERADRFAEIAEIGEASGAGVRPGAGNIPRRKLGKTGIEVSALCFGGAHLGRIESQTEAIRVLHEAIDAGVTFMDNAWEYNQGRSETWMGKGLEGRR